MNWGYRIVFAYLAFVIGIGYLVYRSTQEQVDLVSDKYYEKELKFSDQMQREQNANSKQLKIAAGYDHSSKTITLTYPSGCSGKSVSGEIRFFRPDNAKLDFSVKMSPDSALTQEIKTAALERGLWRLQATWQCAEIPLYQEEKVFIQ